MTRCQAVFRYSYRYKVELLQRCQNSAIHEINGVGLCGTHMNALDHPIQVVIQIERPA